MTTTVPHRVLVLAPHADDEILGVGGTIARHVAAGDSVHVVVATLGQPPLFEPAFIAQTEREVVAAHRQLGVADSIFLRLPSAQLDTVPHHEINEHLTRIVQQLAPDVAYVPFPGDIHLDHQQVFLSALVAMRPTDRFRPHAIYAYETLSETNWSAPYLMPNFQPNVFVDITPHLDAKVAAMEMVTAQIKPFPHCRSAEALRALAALRGSTVGCHAAEAFVLVRQGL